MRITSQVGNVERVFVSLDAREAKVLRRLALGFTGANDPEGAAFSEALVDGLNQHLYREEG